MTVRESIPSANTNLRATAREWVIASNPHAHDWFAYPFFDCFSPFNVALEQTWAIQDGFKRIKGKLTFHGNELPTNAGTPLNPNTARLTAKQALQAIDRFDAKALRRHRREVATIVFFIGLLLSLLFMSFMLSKPAELEHLIASFQYGYGAAVILFMLHRHTCWGRKKINVPKDKIQRLQAEILQLRDEPQWGHNVRRIFQEIELETNPDGQHMAYKELQLRYDELLDRCAAMSDELAQAQEDLIAARAAAEQSKRTDASEEVVLQTESREVRMPVDFLINTVLQSGEPGFKASVAMPILILTAWSLRQNPPNPEDKLQATIYERIDESAKVVRSYCRSMSQHRAELGDDGHWDEYVEHIKLPIYKILVPKEGKKTAYGTGNFKNKFPYLAQIEPYLRVA